MCYISVTKRNLRTLMHRPLTRPLERSNKFTHFQGKSGSPCFCLDLPFQSQSWLAVEDQIELPPAETSFEKTRKLLRRSTPDNVSNFCLQAPMPFNRLQKNAGLASSASPARRRGLAPCGTSIQTQLNCHSGTKPKERDVGRPPEKSRRNAHAKPCAGQHYRSRTSGCGQFAEP